MMGGSSVVVDGGWGGGGVGVDADEAGWEEMSHAVSVSALALMVSTADKVNKCHNRKARAVASAIACKQASKQARITNTRH